MMIGGGDREVPGGMTGRLPRIDLRRSGAVAGGAGGGRGSVPISLLMGALLITGCAPSAPDISVSVDTLANGAIRVTNTGTGLWGPSEGWTLTRTLTLGADPADTLAQFGQIWDFTMDEAGRIYVLDRQVEAVSVFMPDGGFVRRIGRPGQGPGEFRFPTGMAWDADGRLWVANVGNARFEVYDTAGSYLESFPRTAVGFGYPWGGVFLESGSLVEPSSVRSSPDGPSASVALAQHDPGSAEGTVDTLPLPEYERGVWVVDRNPGRLVLGVPFYPELRWQMTRSGDLWVAVNARYGIHQVSPRGDTVRTVSRTLPRLPVQPAELDAQLALLERAAPQVRSRVDMDLVPDDKPAFDVFFFDSSEYLWVARSRENDVYPGGFTNTFDVFDPQGRLLGSVQADISTVPPPRVMGDWLVGVDRDSLETQRLAVYRIGGRESRESAR